MCSHPKNHWPVSGSLRLRRSDCTSWFSYTHTHTHGHTLMSTAALGGGVTRAPGIVSGQAGRRNWRDATGPPGGAPQVTRSFLRRLAALLQQQDELGLKKGSVRPPGQTAGEQIRFPLAIKGRICRKYGAFIATLNFVDLLTFVYLHVFLVMKAFLQRNQQL